MGARIRQPRQIGDKPFRPVPLKPKSKKKFQHFLITRFNIRVKFNKGRGTDQDWLNHRWPFFSKFCIPSIKSQTASGSFRWIVLFDMATPVEWKERIEAQAKGIFEPVWTPDRWNPAFVQKLVLDRLEPDTEYLITSRLDSDDIVSKDYIARIQALFNDQGRCFINFKHGIEKVVKGQTTEYRALQHPRSAFLSLIERVGKTPCATVYCGDHGKVTRRKNVIHVRGHYGWIQILHGRNGCSAMRGRKMMDTELSLMKRVFQVW